VAGQARHWLARAARLLTRQGKLMEAKAITKYIRLSPYKTRRVIDVVRGKMVDEALAILMYMPQKAAREVARTIKSAAANAENNFDMEPADLRIKAIYADQGPALKRYMPRARGRVDMIRKPTTHITVVVDDGEDY
jgi:large subunit ribosomal protein L22